MSNQGSGPAHYMPPPPAPATGGGFFAALFDFSFTRFVTPMIVKVAYVIAVVCIGLAYLAFVASAFNTNSGLGIAVLILGPIPALFYLIFIRMSLEFYLAVVRMSEDIHHRG